MAHHPRYHIKAGILWILVATVSLSLMSACVKVVGDHASVPAILLLRFAFSLIILLPWFLINFKSTIITPHYLLLLGRSFSALAAIISLYLAIRLISLTDAMLFSNCSTLIIPFFVHWIFKQKTPLAVWIGVIVGFMGVLLILNPTDDFLNNKGSLYGLSCAVFSALALTLLRKSGHSVTERQTFFYYFGLSTLVSLIGCFFDWRIDSQRDFWLLILSGFFGLFYQVALTYAIRSAPVRLVSSLLFLSVIFSAFLDWLIFDNIPSWNTFLGALVIISGGCITILFGRSKVIPPNIDRK